MGTLGSGKKMAGEENMEKDYTARCDIKEALRIDCLARTRREAQKPSNKLIHLGCS